MTKRDFLEVIKTKSGVSVKECEKVFDAVFNEIVEIVSQDDSITIQKFGTFKRSYRAPRSGVNPKTKEPLKIPGSYGMKFKPYLGLKEKLNK